MLRLAYQPTKRILFGGVFLCLLYCQSGKAAEIAEEGSMTRKLQRGFLNVILSPLEIGNEIVKTQKYDTALPTWMAGMVKGVGMTAARVGIGAYEIVTAPISFPRNYSPIMQPEFVWENSRKAAETKEAAAEKNS